MSETLLGFVHRFVPGTRTGVTPVLLLHGTGGNEDDLITLGQTLAPGVPLLSPRGQVLENGMPRYFRRLGEGVFDLDDLRFRADQLARFLVEARRTYDLGEVPPIAVGFSNGANMAAALLLLHPGSLSAAVLFRAMVPLVPTPLPPLQEVRVLVAAGRYDPIARPEKSQALADLLAEAGAEVTLHWTRAGHNLTRDDLDAAERWMTAVSAAR